MIGLVGIIGCTTALAIIITGVCVAVVATGISTGYAIAGYYANKEAAEDQAAMEREAMSKTENRGRYQKRMNEKAQERSALKLRAQMGSSVALDQLYSKKLRGKNGRAKAELNSAGANNKVKTNVPRPTRNMGQAKAEVDA